MTTPATARAPDYLDPRVPAGLRQVDVPLIEATPESVLGYGRLVEDYQAHPIEIVRWPAQGWRPVDPDSGDEGGTTKGTFHCEWKGEVLYGRNEAVDGYYILGWSCDPASASETSGGDECDQVLLWHANYHPDGG